MHTLDAEALYRTLFAQLIDAYGPSLGAPDGIAVVGIYSGGAWLAERLAADLLRAQRDAAPADVVRHGVVNVALHRDDFASRGLHGQSSPTHLPFDIAGRRILLLDDVVHTGRTIRAAINELYDYGRPASVELGVLVDRGARELPIAARFAATRVTLEAAQSLVMTRDAAGGFGFDLARRST